MLNVVQPLSANRKLSPTLMKTDRFVLLMTFGINGYYCICCQAVSFHVVYILQRFLEEF